MHNTESIKDYLKNYNGKKVKLMEVCGTHTAAIARSGIRSILSPEISLVSGPGCPVCVSSTGYIDALCELSKNEGCCVASFGDMLRVTGSKESLVNAMADGGKAIMLYSPFELLKLAKENPKTTYVFAAIGFETTSPLYALLLEKAVEFGINNIKLLTSLQILPPILEWLCSEENDITGFIAPGHVSVITGEEIYKPIAEDSGLPFVISGFESEDILKTVFLLTKMQGQGKVYNLYTSAVKPDGNKAARDLVSKYFEPGDAYLRGLGIVKNSGLYLKPEYQHFDAGSKGFFEDNSIQKQCRCSDILTGRINPTGCPLYGKVCTEHKPKGACMVSSEGACRIWLENEQ